MKFLAVLSLFVCLQCDASETRFGGFYFYQNDAELKEKQVNLPDLARFSRQAQSAVWQVLKSVRMKPSTGYLILAIRDDKSIAVWLDMEPAIHEYYAATITDTIKKLLPFSVTDGAVVFAINMAINTPQREIKLIIFTTSLTVAPTNNSPVLESDIFPFKEF